MFDQKLVKSIDFNRNKMQNRSTLDFQVDGFRRLILNCRRLDSETLMATALRKEKEQKYPFCVKFIWKCFKTKSSKTTNLCTKLFDHVSIKSPTYILPYFKIGNLPVLWAPLIHDDMNHDVTNYKLFGCKKIHNYSENIHIS